MELLILLVERRGELVSREEVADRLWGTNVFVEVDHGINTAVRKIRRVLRDDSDEPRFVETVVGKGYRFAAPVTCNGEISRGAPSVEQAPRLPSEPGTPSAAVGSAQKRAASPKTLLPLIILLAIFVSMAAWWLYRGRAPRSEGQPAIHSLAVLPLKNLSGDPAQEYLADGMTEELIGRLSRIHDLRVAVDGFVRTILSSYPSES